MMNKASDKFTITRRNTKLATVHRGVPAVHYMMIDDVLRFQELGSSK